MPDVGGMTLCAEGTQPVTLAGDDQRLCMGATVMSRVCSTVRIVQNRCLINDPVLRSLCGRRCAMRCPARSSA
eukprot:2277587-Rhodomonas_salina.2